MTRAGWVAVLVLFGCAGLATRDAGEPLHLSRLGSGDDAIRRASLRLCVDGLDADAAGRPGAAQGHYERAIQIDPTNPYAYLVLARHELETGDPDRALQYLDQAQTLLAAEGALSPRVEAHLAGLRGGALDASGGDGSELLAEARRLSPEEWSDGRLSASELR